MPKRIERIERFEGEYSFLSNFSPAEVVFEGITYPTVEHAYQAAKTVFPDEREWVRSQTSPALARKAGRKVTKRADWDPINTMSYLVAYKFVSHKDLAEKLLATKPAELIEGNWWGDEFWGVCNGKGKNNLGRILMKVRDIILTN